MFQHICVFQKFKGSKPGTDSIDIKIVVFDIKDLRYIIKVP